MIFVSLMLKPAIVCSWQLSGWPKRDMETSGDWKALPLSGVSGSAIGEFASRTYPISKRSWSCGFFRVDVPIVARGVD